jgi:hypothetical protein
MTLLYASAAWAETFTVTNLKAAGPGSLRAAVNAAEARAGADEIVFADGVSGTVRLNWEYPLPMVTDPEGLVIDGGGDVTVSRTALGAVQPFAVGEGAGLTLKSLTVSDGSGADSDIGTPVGGAMMNTGGTVVVTNSTFSNNSAGVGGGIYNDGGTLEVTNSTISGNHAAFQGGGIVNTGGGTVTITDSTVSRNGTDMWGGPDGILNENGTVEVINSTISEGIGFGSCCSPVGIENYSTLEVTNSTFSDNSTGIANHNGSESTSRAVVTNSTFSDNEAGIGNSGTLEVNNSTFSGNSVRAISNFAFSDIWPNSGTLKVANSTFSGNSGIGRRCDEFGSCTGFAAPGSAIYNGGGTLEVTNSTLSGNSTFSGNSTSTGSTVFNGNDSNGNAGKATLRNTIVANSISGGNCGGEVPITDGGYNIDDESTCGFTPETDSLSNTDPLLDPAGLADNGGRTQTIALLPESPAVDLVGQDACPPPETDQRGVERPQGEACDAGAFELVQGPQTKADCKQGGWEEFGFKNEGQCIASLQREQVQTSQ